MKLITIYSSMDSIEAVLKKGFLEAAGIEAFIKNNAFSGTDPLGMLTFSEVELQVDEADADRALEILGIYEEAEGQPVLESEEPPAPTLNSVLHCPSCGTQNSFLAERGNKFLSFLFNIFRLPDDSETTVHVCRTCGFEWPYKPSEDSQDPDADKDNA